MKTIDLGKSGLTASQIALGCMRIASIDGKELERHIQTALECGINFFDHADVYGMGACEEKFGQVLAGSPGLRPKILLQTKCGICRGNDSIWGYDFSKEYILECVDKALARLHTDYLDVLVLHRPDMLLEPAEIAEAFSALEQSGKVRYFGVSNMDTRQMELVQSALKQKLLVNQVQFGVMCTGLIDHAMHMNSDFPHAADRDGELLDYCRLRGVTIQAWSPFQYGFVKGVFLDNPDFPEINQKMDEIAEKYGISKTALSVAWILRHPAQMQVIVGTTNPERLKDICTASDVTLSRKDWYGIYRTAGNRLL